MSEEAGQTRAGAEEHGLKAFLGEQLVDGDRAADDGVGHDLDAHGSSSAVDFASATIALGRRNSGMPYTRTPPALWNSSYTVTS